jgi:protein-tyrosine phosphatase
VNSQDLNFKQLEFKNFDKVSYQETLSNKHSMRTFDLKEIKTLMALVFSCLSFESARYNSNLMEIIEEDSIDIEAQKIIRNFYQIDKNYYRGAAPDIKGLEYLIECKRVKTIIDLRYLNFKDLSKQESTVKNAGLNYINIPMCPLLPPNSTQINHFLSIVNNLKNQPVYVHCREGKDRTGIMTAIYRVKNYNYSFNKAFTEMIKLGHHVNLFPLLKVWLFNYI